MDSFDFIVVGAGAAGCLLASRLAKALNNDTVLLVDAGGENADATHQSYGERYWTLVTAPGYNWGYKTVPQTQLMGREIDSSKGKGLGGSTAINFCVYTRGPKADYDHWAELVGDDTWCWTNTQRRFNEIERFHRPIGEMKPFVDVSDSAHGFDGPVDVGLAEHWDPSFGEYLENIYQYHPKNLDHNSGNPLGVGVCQVSAHNGHRTTASGAYLATTPSNLTIITGAAVTKVLFHGEKAIGVEMRGKNGDSHPLPIKPDWRDAYPPKVHARKEVILSAGAIDTPKLLLLSGLGPKEDLQTHGIPVVKELSGVGKNLLDHLFLILATVRKPGSHHRSSYLNSLEALEEARKQWNVDQTGPISTLHLPQMVSFFKSSAVLCSQEFAELDARSQKGLQAETKPTYELLSQNPGRGMEAPEQYLATAVAFPGNFQGGEIKLQSSNPDDPPVIDPRFLTHPFDRRVAIESLREALEFLNTPSLAKDSEGLANGPTGRDDDALLNHVRRSAVSMWHSCGTIKMGKPGEPDTCVDKDFCVVGVQGLRVVDMSIAPLLPTAHTQSVAYLIGETAAEKIVSQYEHS